MNTDVLSRFMVQELGVRGVIVRLGPAWREVYGRAPYPEPVRRVLGEMLSAAALMAGDIKLAGSISIQVHGEQALTLAFAECGADGRLRGLAHWREPLPERIRPDALGAGARMAITIERLAANQRYQGLVPLEAGSFAGAIEDYFQRSEQLPSALWLHVDADACLGVMVQQLPRVDGQDLRERSDAFAQASALMGLALSRRHDAMDDAGLLQSAFGEHDVEYHPGTALHFGCRCSRAGVAQMLRTLGRDEARAAAAESGFAEVTCEFCNERYAFDRFEIEQMFEPGLGASGSRAHH